jgi:transcriptional regulator with GAF, ATPase, and Fis domain
MAKLDLIGSSTIFRTAFNQISMVAPVDFALLVQGEAFQGEAGTGKEVLAGAIHEASPHLQKRFAVVNAIPAALLKNDLNIDAVINVV